ncbi:MAG: ribonuclease T [Pseudomonadota bacterium]
MSTHHLSDRFRGFCPVVVDVETSGLDPKKNALLEVGVVTLKMDEHGLLHPDTEASWHVEPFAHAVFDEEAMRITGINPFHPFRFAIPESEAMEQFFNFVNQAKKQSKCTRAVLVGQNAWFDLHMVQAAATRVGHKKNPFHPFTCFDTATLSGLVYGHTVLSKALGHAGIDYDSEQAHSALYDARVTANLFCTIVNRWKDFGGWPLKGLNETHEAEADDQNL